VAIRAVIYDIGGVLEITPSTGWVERWERRLGLEVGQLLERPRRFWQAGSIGAMTSLEIREGVAETLGLDGATVDSLLDDMWDEYLGTLNEPLVAYIRELRRRGYKIGIISNSFVGAREREQAMYRFGELADIIIYSHEEGVSKPDPRIYRILCERLTIAPAEAVFVDDLEEMIDGARSAGMQAVMFLNTEQAVADLERLIAAEAGL
jgi:epoxide hydrolase-like predicted phosphatase